MHALSADVRADTRVWGTSTSWVVVRPDTPTKERLQMSAEAGKQRKPERAAMDVYECLWIAPRAGFQIDCKFLSAQIVQCVS